jgi:hypothetical protein
MTIQISVRLEGQAEENFMELVRKCHGDEEGAIRGLFSIPFNSEDPMVGLKLERDGGHPELRGIHVVDHMVW